MIHHLGALNKVRSDTNLHRTQLELQAVAQHLPHMLALELIYQRLVYLNIN